MNEDGFSYVKVKQMPIDSMSQRSIKMNFSATAFLKHFDSLVLGMSQVKTYYAGDKWPKFPNLPSEGITFLDWPVAELDDTPFTRLKSLMVIESKLEESADICARNGGTFPTPRYQDAKDDSLFKKILTKLGVSEVLVSYSIKQGSYVHPDGTLLNSNPLVQHLYSSSASTVTEAYDTVLKVPHVNLVRLTKDFNLSILSRSSDVTVAKNLCMIPRLSHLGVASNEQTAKGRFDILSNEVSDFVSNLREFRTGFDRSSFGKVESSSGDQTVLPFWMVSASEILTVLKTYKARLDDKVPFDSLLQMIRKVSSDVSLSTEFLDKHVIQLGSALCQMNVSATLDCVDQDNSRSWARMDFVPTTSSSGYQLAFSNVVFEVHRTSWIGCFTQNYHDVFMLLPDTCCKLLSSNDGGAISECPSFSLNTGYLGARVGHILHSISSHDQVLQRCTRATIEEIGDDSFLAPTKCNLQFLRNGFLATILNKIGSTAQAILPFNGNRSYSEKDKTKFLIWGLIGGAACLCIVLVFVLVLICCPQTFKKCIPLFCAKRLNRLDSSQTDRRNNGGLSLDSEGVNAFRVGTNSANNAIEDQQFEMIEEFPLVRATRTVVVRDRSANPNRRR